VPTLSEQEKRLLRLLAMGRTDKHISGELDIAEDTVGWHLRVLYREFHVCCRTALVARCLEQGLLTYPISRAQTKGRAPTPELHE
jgi:DNA-binding NarL/FixJ family response regulator